MFPGLWLYFQVNNCVSKLIIFPSYVSNLTITVRPWSRVGIIWSNYNGDIGIIFMVFSIERLDSNSIIHGLNEAPTIISTPLPAVMKLNTTNIKWKERSDLDSRHGLQNQWIINKSIIFNKPIYFFEFDKNTDFITNEKKDIVIIDNRWDSSKTKWFSIWVKGHTAGHVVLCWFAFELPEQIIWNCFIALRERIFEK